MRLKTIIMLSLKRCGSTATFRMFQNHPEVGVCHVDQGIDNWEPNFWNLAAKALQGDREPFVERFRESHPFLRIPQALDKHAVFELWDQILEAQGPAVFDKSPQYLHSVEAIDLMAEYKNLGNDVRVFAFVRDPRDAITSQYTLWRRYVENDSPATREIAWLKGYNNLEPASERLGFIPVFRYEDFAAAPACYAPMIFDHCGIANVPECFAHIRPTNIGSYSASLLPGIMTWRMGSEFVEHLIQYGYRVPQLPILDRIWLKSTRGVKSLALSAARSLPQPIQSILKQTRDAWSGKRSRAH